jgi:pimeloyl-ACP methyl ester carboxylesterase
MIEIGKVALDGLSLAVRKSGEARKPCLVLLHGWPQTSLAWESVFPELGRTILPWRSIYRGLAILKARLPPPRRRFLPISSSPQPNTLAGRISSSLAMTWAG